MHEPDGTIGKLWRSAAGLRAIVHVMASICIVATGNSLLTTTVSLHLSDPALDPHVVQLLLTAFPIGFLGGCLSALFLVASNFLIGQRLVLWSSAGIYVCMV